MKKFKELENELKKNGFDFQAKWFKNVPRKNKQEWINSQFDKYFCEIKNIDILYRQVMLKILIKYIKKGG